MDWLGKVLGGGLGAFFGGPLGAIAGSVLGHHLLDSKAQSRAGDAAASQRVYLVSTFSMSARIARADGAVSKRAIEVIERLMHQNMQLTTEGRAFAISVFNEAKTSTQPYRDFALQLHAEFRGTPAVLEAVLELLLLVANADGPASVGKERLLREAARAFGLESRLDELRRLTGSGSHDVAASYALLGSNRSDSLAVIKKRYRRMVMTHHPDRLAGQADPVGVSRVAEDRFKEIQNAWETIQKVHE